MNLGGDKALLERIYPRWSKGCVYVCILTCVSNQKPEQEPVAFLHLVAHKWRQTPQASGSKRWREGGEGKGFRGTLSFCWPLDHWSSWDCALVLGSIRQNGAAAFRDSPCPQHLGPGGGVLHSYALISDHRSGQSQDQRIDSEHQWKRLEAVQGSDFSFFFGSNSLSSTGHIFASWLFPCKSHICTGLFYSFLFQQIKESKWFKTPMKLN